MARAAQLVTQDMQAHTQLEFGAALRSSAASILRTNSNNTSDADVWRTCTRALHENKTMYRIVSTDINKRG